MQISPLDDFDQLEQDTIKEIGNISMGSSATILSQLMSHRVNITTPTLAYKTMQEVNRSFIAPCVLVEVEYVEGIIGKNLLIIDQRDAVIIGQLMMMEEPNPDEEINEIHLSAVGEAMNQMMGSAATAMSEIFDKMINISSPMVTHKQLEEAMNEDTILSGEDGLIQISFRIEVAGLIDSELLQFMPIDFARQMVDFLLSRYRDDDSTAPLPDVLEDEPEIPAREDAPLVNFGGSKGLVAEEMDFIGNISLELEGIVGRSKLPLEMVLQFGIGSVIELDSEIGDDVEILVNGKKVANAEIVAVNNQYGLKLTKLL